MAGEARAASYTWTQTSAATQDWSLTGNWSGGTVDTGPGTDTDVLTFFSDITTSLPSGANSITTNVPAALLLNTLTLNGKGPAATPVTTVAIGTSASTLTFDGTAPTINLNGVNTSTTNTLAYTIATNLGFNQNMTIAGTGTAGYTFSGALTLAADMSITASGSASATFSGAATINSSLTFANNGTGSYTFSGILSGATASLIKTGTGGLTVNGANTFGGGLFIKAGTVGSSGTTTPFGTSTISLGDTVATSNGATLFYNGAGPVTNNITVNAGSTGLLRIQSNGTSPTFSGIVTLNNNLTINETQTNRSMIFTGKVTGGAGTTLTLQGNYNPTLFTGINFYNTSNDFTADIVITGGGVAFANHGLGDTGNISITGNTFLQWGAATTQDLSTGRTLSASNGTTVYFDTGAYNSTSNNVTLASPFFSGSSANLIKFDKGILTIGGVNTYTGTTTVGTLFLNITNFVGGQLRFTTGSAASSPGFVLNGATGTGALGNDMAFDNSGIAADSSITRLASLTLTNNGNTNINNGLLVIGSVTTNTANSTDNLSGALAVTGVSDINTTPVATTAVGNVTFTPSTGTGTTTLTVGSIARGNGTLLQVQGGTLGSTTFLKTTGTAPTPVNGVIPWTVSNTGGFLTYDATNGLVLATTVAMPTSGPAGNVNNAVGSTTILTADATINSYYSNTAGAKLDLAGNTLTVASGGMMFGQNTAITGGTLALGAAEGVFIHQGTNVLITSVITGSAAAGTPGLTLTRSGGAAAASASVAYVLAGANTYTGITTVPSATQVVVANSNALQNSTVNLVGGALVFGSSAANQPDLGDTNITTANFGGLAGLANIALTNTGSSGGGVALTIGSDGDSTTYSGVLSGAGSLTMNGTGTITMSGVHTFTGGLNKQGSGTLNMSSTTNAYAGATAISAGTLRISSATVFTNATTISLSGTGRLDLNVANQSLVKLVTGVPAGTFLRYSQNQATAGAANGPGTILGTVEVNVATVSPNYPLTLGGGSVLTSSLAGTYGGAIALAGNTTFRTSATSLTTSGAISGTGNLTLDVTGTAAMAIGTGAVNFTGNITHTGSGAGTMTISSVIGANVTGIIQDAPTSVLNLSANNLFTGGVLVKNGTVAAISPGSTGSFSSARSCSAILRRPQT